MNAALEARPGRTAAPPLAQIFSSSTMPRVIAALALRGRLNLTDLRTAVPVTRAMLEREVNRLCLLGLLQSERVGAMRFVELNIEHPATPHVRALALLAFGPPKVVGEELGALPGIQRAFIFGSWAARSSGQAGALPNDLDVIAVGKASRDDIYEVERRVTHRLGIESEIKLISAAEWEAPRDAFIRSVKERALVEVELQRGAARGRPSTVRVNLTPPGY